MRQGITPQQIADYQRQNPHAKQKDIAAHFKVSDRHIRNLQKQVNQYSPRPARRARRVSPPLAPRSTTCRVIRLMPGLVARKGTLWRCPKCLELMPPMPGTLSEDWNLDGCYLHQAQPNTLQQVVAQVVPTAAAVPELPINGVSTEIERNTGTTALQSHTSDTTGTPEVNDLESNSAGQTSAGSSQPASNDQVIVVKQIVYIRPALVSYIALIPPQVLIALVVVVALVALCMAQLSGTDPWNVRP